MSPSIVEVLQTLIVGGGLAALLDLVRKWRADRDDEENRDIDLARVVKRLAAEEIDYYRQVATAAREESHEALATARKAERESASVRASLDRLRLWSRDIVERWDWWRTQEHPPTPPE